MPEWGVVVIVILAMAGGFVSVIALAVRLGRNKERSTSAQSKSDAHETVANRKRYSGRRLFRRVFGRRSRPPTSPK